MANINDQDDSLDLSDDFLYEFASNMDDDANNNNNNPMNSNIEEQHLSQKLSQLSASEHEKLQSTTMKKRSPLQSPSTTTTISKKIKIDKEKLKDTKIPHYLSINNKAFNQMIQSILSKTANSLNIEDFQEIAVLIHQITILDLQKLLWNAYLRSGTGTIEKKQSSKININLCLWPSEVKSIIIKNKQTTAININQINNDDCLNYVNRTLHQFIDRTIQYQKQLDEKQHRLNNSFKYEIEEAIVQFIEQQEISFIHIEIESKIAIVEYDYQDRLIELEFNQLKPNSHQLHLFEHFTQIKQEKEKSKYEVELLKQRFIYNCLPESLDALQLPLPLPPSSIDRIQDEKNRQNLFDRYTKILHQTKSDMMALYIAIAEVKMHECQLKFDIDTNQQMRPDQRSTTIHQRLNRSMIDILERRFKNIDQRLEYLYKLKIRFLEKKSFNNSHHV